MWLWKPYSTIEKSKWVKRVKKKGRFINYQNFHSHSMWPSHIICFLNILMINSLKNTHPVLLTSVQAFGTGSVPNSAKGFWMSSSCLESFCSTQRNSGVRILCFKFSLNHLRFSPTREIGTKITKTQKLSNCK